jgi:hypothetical protein
MSTQPAYFTEEELDQATSEPDPFDHDEWRRIGRTLSRENDDRQWKLGFWLDTGVGKLGEPTAIKEAIKITGSAITTLWDYARTARAFPEYRDPNSRRRDLKWSHHKEVAIEGLTKEKRNELLDRAELEKWSIPDLRTQVRNEIKKQNCQPQGEKLYRLQASVNKATFQFVIRAAKGLKKKRSLAVGLLLDQLRQQRES